MKFNHEKTLAGAALAFGGYLLLDALQGRVTIGPAHGSIGGSDPLTDFRDLGGHRGFDIDPNVKYESQPVLPSDELSQVVEGKYTSEYQDRMIYDLSGQAYDNPFALQTQEIPHGFKVITDAGGKIIGYQDPIKEQSIYGNPFEDPFSSLNIRGTMFDTPYEQKIQVDEQLTQEHKTPIYDDGGNIAGYYDYEKQQSVMGKPVFESVKSTGLEGVGFTNQQFGMSSHMGDNVKELTAPPAAPQDSFSSLFSRILG